MKTKCDTFTKNRAFAVMGYSYAGTPYVCAVFSDYADAQTWIDNQDDGWTYSIEQTFHFERNLPF